MEEMLFAQERSPCTAAGTDIRRPIRGYWEQRRVGRLLRPHRNPVAWSAQMADLSVKRTLHGIIVHDRRSQAQVTLPAFSGLGGATADYFTCCDAARSWMFLGDNVGYITIYDMRTWQRVAQVFSGRATRVAAVRFDELSSDQPRLLVRLQMSPTKDSLLSIKLHEALTQPTPLSAKPTGDDAG